MRSDVLGHSQQKRQILCHQLTEGKKNLLLIGGVHGDEPEGFYLVERFQREGAFQILEGKAALWVLPRLNPDGCAQKQRTNANGVDLNRNMPTKDWNAEAREAKYHPGKSAGSEIETQLLMQLIQILAPTLIISAHSWNPLVNYNGPSRLVAEEMAKHNGYKVTGDIGYPTPGSLGTWAGWERKIPTITLEVERGADENKIWSVHAKGLVAGLCLAAEHKLLG